MYGMQHMHALSRDHRDVWGLTYMDARRMRWERFAYGDVSGEIWGLSDAHRKTSLTIQSIGLRAIRRSGGATFRRVSNGAGLTRREQEAVRLLVEGDAP